MWQWIVFDIGLSLVPVVLVWLGTYLAGRFQGWLHPLRDGQLCFFSAALAAITLRDVYQLGRPDELDAALARLNRLVDDGRDAAICKTFVPMREVGMADLAACLHPPPDVWVAFVLLILVIILSTFVFGIAVTIGINGQRERDNRLAWMSVWIAAMAVLLTGVVRYHLRL